MMNTYIHLFISALPKYSPSKLMNIIKVLLEEEYQSTFQS